MFPPSGTFVDPSGYDPLRRSCTDDYFWYSVEPSFRPFVQDDVRVLRELAAPRESHSRDDTRFPISHRLVAALLDEGSGAAAVSTAARAFGVPTEQTWLPGALPALRSFNRVFELRVKHQLIDAGILSPMHDGPLAERIRLDEWHLRNVAAINADAERKMRAKMAVELKTQSARREAKRKQDHIEVQYIKKMIETGVKRSKTRFSKLLTQMHPHRNLRIGAPVPAISKVSHGGSENDRKKKKRKSKPPPHTDTDADIALTVADIIRAHGNYATMPQIVADFLKRGRHLSRTESETHCRIGDIIARSRKPYRFAKNSDKTYSVLHT